MTAKIREGINLNTLLITLVLALSGWTLKTMVEQSQTSAVTVSRVNTLDKAVEALDQRVIINTRDISDLRARK